MFLLSGCGWTINNKDADFCLIYEPLYYPKDTHIDLQRQIAWYNETWESMCK